jgi:hypothetical protein
MTIHLTWALRGHNKVINCPNFKSEYTQLLLSLVSFMEVVSSITKLQ